MEIIVYPLLGCVVILLVLVGLGKLGPGRVNRLSLMSTKYQAIIDLSQRAKRVVADSTDDAQIATALDGLQHALNAVALDPEAVDVYRLGEDYCLVLRAEATRRKHSTGDNLSEDVLELQCRDVQQAARDSLDRMRRGESVHSGR